MFSGFSELQYVVSLNPIRVTKTRTFDSGIHQVPYVSVRRGSSTHAFRKLLSDVSCMTDAYPMSDTLFPPHGMCRCSIHETPAVCDT